VQQPILTKFYWLLVSDSFHLKTQRLNVMQTRSFTPVVHLSCLAVSMFLSTSLCSQTIQMSKQPFNESPAIPLAPAKTQIVPGGGSGQPQIAVSNSPTQKTWRVLNEDIRLATTFDRWAREAGYRLISLVLLKERSIGPCLRRPY
jgi:hypothetical protein